MPDLDVDRARLGHVSLDAPGTEEVQVVPWPLLLQRRVAERVERSSRFPALGIVVGSSRLVSDPMQNLVDALLKGEAAICH